MRIVMREYRPEDVPAMNAVWNAVVEEGLAFPQLEDLDDETGAAFYAGQSFTGVAEETQSGRIVGLYILHPNNIGRCGHIANTSYAVSPDARGLKVGEHLVTHSLEKAREKGFRILQFNAVVATNVRALRLYERLGFVQLGAIPGGFLQKDGHYADIIPHYYNLV